MSTTIIKKKIGVTVKDFRKAWGALRPVGTKNSTPILNYLKIHSNGVTTSITATNLDIEITVQLQASEGDFTVFCDSAMIAAALKGANAGAPVTFREEGFQVGVASYQYGEQPDPDDWPISMEVKDEFLRNWLVPSATIQAATRYASSDETRYIMNGIYFGKAEVAATDGRRLIVIPCSGMQEDFILGKSAAVLAKHLFDGDVSVSCNDGFCRLQQDGRRLIARRIEGTYPKYNQVIPKEKNGEFEGYDSAWDATLSATQGADVVKFLRAHPGKKNRTTLLSMQGATVDISHKGDDKENFTASIKVDGFFGLDVNTAVDARLMADLLEDCDAVLVKDELSPLVGTNDGKFRCLLMPLRLN
jgi:DNA polymerase III sliding clamp (beta) subunit (PCNA family)